MNHDLDRTLQAIALHNWRCVLLERGQKRPVAGRPWQVTSHVDTLRAHLASGCGVGLVTGESGITVLDFDDMDAYSRLSAQLGPVVPWVTSPSTGIHAYFKQRPDLPAKILWNGRVAGEVQRGPRQQVVIPPSPYPGKPSKGIPSGGFYEWLVDPRGELSDLPVAWVGYLLEVPDHITLGDARGHEANGNDWHGEPAEVIVKRALDQPGAKLRKNGVHFQCLGCERIGRDRSMDNAIAFLSGKFTCATFGASHRSAIAEQLRLGLDYDEPEAPLCEDLPDYKDPMDAPLCENVPGYMDPNDAPLCEDLPGYEDPNDAPLEEDAKATLRGTRRARRSAARSVRQ